MMWSAIKKGRRKIRDLALWNFNKRPIVQNRTPINIQG
jgi:hypothetical protein